MRRRELSALLPLALLPGSSRSQAQPIELLTTGTTARFEPAYFGMHVHNNGSERNWPDIPIGSLRLWDADVSWAYLERRRGDFDFRRLDEYVGWTMRRGIEAVVPLAVTPPWASARPQEKGAYGPGTSAEPASLETWRAYVRAVVSRYRGRVGAYEIGNEVNESWIFSGTLQAILQMTVSASEEIRKTDPDARVIAPSFVGLDQRVELPARFLSMGGAAAVDAASFHLYHSGHPPEAMVEPVRRMVALKAAAGHAAVPMWNTESGYWMPNPQLSWNADETRNMVSEGVAAMYLPRDLILARALGFSRFHWYAWDGNKMGLLDPVTRRHRLPADVYGQAIRELSGLTMDSCARSADGLWRCRLRSAKGQGVQALWVDPAATRQRQTVPLARTGRWLTLDARSSWQPSGGEVAAGPVVTLTSEAG
jgi:Cellulase (glycosyl hydrolase family 5)